MKHRIVALLAVVVALGAGAAASPQRGQEIADNGTYLYNLNSGTHTISSFRIQPDGSLAPLPFGTDVPVAVSGLASR